MVKSYNRGNEMIWSEEDEWTYVDNGKRVDDDVFRQCGNCERGETIEGHDGCLGTLIGVKNACCGHGIVREAYIQFLDGMCIRGVDAIIVQDVLKRAKID